MTDSENEPVALRPELPVDLDAKAALFRAARSRFAVTADELRAITGPYLDGSTQAHYDAALVDGPDGLLAAASIWQLPHRRILGHYEVEVVVHPEVSSTERARLEAALDEWLTAAVPPDAEQLRAGAYTDTPAHLAWAVRRGFHEQTRTWRSTQDVASVELPRAALPDGWRVRPFLDVVAEQGSDEAWRQLNDVSYEARCDIPLADAPTPESSEEFRSRRLAIPNVDEGGIVVCCDERGRIVGYTEFHRDPQDPTLAHVGLTGVARTARRRGVALALKVAATELARERGVARLDTWNDSHNEPMLAINRRLGFLPDRTYVMLTRPWRRGDDLRPHAPEPSGGAPGTGAIDPVG